ncbi:flagellar biosynthetic protein FliP [Variovorax boronicumulans]|nr:flagellar biosynthetic protein FliP [Variovorax boronicumulans]
MRRSWHAVLAPMLLAIALFGLPVDSARSQSLDEAASEVVPGSPTLEAPPAAPVTPAAPAAIPPTAPAAATPQAAPLVTAPSATAPPVSAPESKAAPTAAANPVRPKAAPAAAATPAPSATPATETAQALRVVLGLTVLAILPALLVCLTSFLRIIVVLSMLRHAIGMNETPPNTVLIGLALFLTLFTMSPVLQKVNHDAFEPFMAGKLSMEDGYGKGMTPLREFMVRQTREADLALMVELSKAPMPKSMDDISNVQLIPSFMLSELRAAFQIGFVIFLPFLLIDLIVSSILMALGMMMMPPTTIALPLKVLMFILVDGWSLVLKALVGSFH